MVGHPQLGYVNPSSVSYNLGARRVHLNFHGLRMDGDIPYEKPAGEKRVLALGDSVVFGAAVNQGDTFSDRLEQLLRARTGEMWHVINSGVNGYNSEQEATYLRIEGMRYTPDVVILVYVPNDTSPKDTLASHHRYWYRFPKWPSPEPAPPSSPRELFDRLLNLSLGYTLMRMNFAEISKEKFPSITKDPGWAYSRGWVEDAANQCNARAVPFLVALYRGKDEKFLADLSSSGIDAISLEPAWQKVPANKRQPSHLDPHPSAAVHAEMAVVLLEALQVRGWLASPSDDRRHLK
jgi:GDSL-like lipase/acylhydrolase family protein